LFDGFEGFENSLADINQQNPKSGLKRFRGWGACVVVFYAFDPLALNGEDLRGFLLL